MHRSRSVPVLTEDDSTYVGAMFRIVPTTPRIRAIAHDFIKPYDFPDLNKAGFP